MLKCIRVVMETYRVGIVWVSSQGEKTKTRIQVTGTNTGMELLWSKEERKGERKGESKGERKGESKGESKGERVA